MIETVFRTAGYISDRHLELVEAAKQSLLQRKPITLGPDTWVIVGITMNERQQTIHIRGVRVRPEPLPTKQERLP
jgi:hypothetical protein